MGFEISMYTPSVRCAMKERREVWQKQVCCVVLNSLPLFLSPGVQLCAALSVSKPSVDRDLDAYRQLLNKLTQAKDLLRDYLER